MNKRGLYVGVDESNHGRHPEVFVAVCSDNIFDAERRSNLMKIRKNHETLFMRLGRRYFTFLLMQEIDIDGLKGYGIIPAVTASLLSNIDIADRYTSLDIFIDGELKAGEKEKTKRLVSGVVGIERALITVNSGTNFDRSIRLVNLADELAHYIFRKVPLERLATEYKEHQRELIMP